MTTKNLTGNYPSGYAIATAITTLNVETGANVGGSGLTDAATYVTISNYGAISNAGPQATAAAAITFADGG